MESLIKESPVVLRLPGNSREVYDRHLTYVNNSVDHLLRKHKKNAGWFLQKYGNEAFTERLEQLKADRVKSLVFQDDRGFWTYTGVSGMLENVLGFSCRSQVVYPETQILPWDHVPSGSDRYYQSAAFDKLVAAKHGAVEIGTGLGKTRIIRNLAKHYGLKTVIMAPSESIAKQIYDDFVTHFGKKRVGFVGDGKKQYDRLFTVGIAASLRNLEPGSEGWEHLSKAEVALIDESHLVAAATLAAACTSLLAAAPYRFFFSGTQMRNDGADLLLASIIGAVVFQMTVQEGVDQGFLAKPLFRMVRINSTVKCNSDDPNTLTRQHVFYSPQVNRLAADFANKAVSLMGRPTLILIDEVEQLSYLLPHLRYQAKFAHGGLNKLNRDKVPVEYHASDPKQLVKDFDAGKFPILVGTSCISMGTDIQNVKCGIYLRGGKSEPEVKQAVGRITRKPPGKEDALWIDFAIDNVDTLARHAKERKAIYSDIYPSYSEIRL